MTAYLPPGGPNVRMDSHLYSDYLVPSNYDSLLGKLVVWGEDRTAAINRMKRALTEMVIAGVPTTAPYHLLILDNEYFKAGDVDTGFIAKHGDELVLPAEPARKVRWGGCTRKRGAGGGDERQRRMVGKGESAG